MRNKHSNRTACAAGAVVLALVTVSCGTASTDANPANNPTTATPTGPTETPTTRTRRANGTTITTAPSDFGQVLWGPNRQVVYIWEAEPTATAECYDDCAKAWPPVLTTGRPVAAGKVDAALLGTTKRRDGSTQVTYNDHPLYFYAHEGPGEVKCHNIATHGGLWWVITPAGEPAA